MSGRASTATERLPGTCLASAEIRLDLDAPRLCRSGEGGVVELVLVGVALGEVGDRLVEGIALAHVGADRDPVAGPRVSPCQRPAADAGVDLEALWRQIVDVDRALPVPELADVEVPLLVVRPARGKPAEQDVARGLHEPLALHDAL